MDDFYAYAETSAYHADLRITLSLIHQGKRKKHLRICRIRAGEYSAMGVSGLMRP